MKSFCYINGKTIPTSEASIGVTDLALQRGYGVFDYLRMYNGCLFHFNDHYERFSNSAYGLNLKLHLSQNNLKDISLQLITESELKRPALRLILTGGYSGSVTMFEKPNLIIITEELPTYPAELYVKGAKLITVNFQRELPHVKSINYLNAFRLEILKMEKGALDILYHGTHGITECPRNNFFIFRGNKLVTPKDLILHGITRKIILQLAENYFVVEEQKIELEELNAADEAFITSTTKGIIPITQIDQNKIGKGSAGNNTKKLMQLFNDYTRGYKLQ